MDSCRGEQGQLFFELVPALFLLGLLLAPSAHAGGAFSTSYVILTDSLVAGGGRANSFIYNRLDSLGTTTQGQSNSFTYVITAGFPQIISSITSADSDGDGLTDITEAQLGTDPDLADTDNDGLTDFEETNADGVPTNYTPGIDTDPTNSDTDGDGIPDNTDPVIDLFNGDLAPLGNRDGVVNAADLLIATRIALGLYIPDTDDLLHGDVNHDGVIDLSDVLLIQKLIIAP